MRWYRFWKKSGPNQNYNEDYKLLEDFQYNDEENLKLKAEDWAETVGGGFNTHYSYGWERIETPSEDWLKNEITHLEIKIEALSEELKELITLKREHYGNKRYSTKK